MNRIHFMDSMRGVLMIAGIVLHSANIYHLDGNWVISDSEQSQIFNWLTYFISIFRMPAFFIISGYFCLFTYQKYGPETFLVRRLTQLCIPLITTTLTLNMLQNVILYYSEVASFADHPRGWAWGFLTTGAWISHLWFLTLLVIYVMIFGSLMPLIDKTPTSTTEWIAKYFRTRKWLIYLIAPFFLLAIKAIGYLHPDIFYRQFAGFSIMTLAHFSFYFAFGILLYRHENMIASLIKVPNIIAFTGYLLGMVLLTHINQESLLYKAAHTYLQYMFSIIITFFIWQIFKKFFNKENRFFTALSKSCYSIYLFHHIIIIILGILLMPVAISAFAKFTIISITALIVSYSIHYYIIDRYLLFRFLFNGKQS
ncbi:hypothetical protein ACH42_14920 [Endozoicomonas sp. (ex Bugula neritina AB1)]|nr:hypothetical protein ACH42_14920 [Endozoicomonas sp. (ex Bugula neritina AB1)]